LAESLVKINNGHMITTIFNTTKQDAELPNPVVRVVQLRDHDVCETAMIGVAEQEKGRDDPGQSRGDGVMAKLRTDHLNSEKKSLHGLCFDYKTVFLPGDKLACTNAARHTIQLEPGVTPLIHDPTGYPKVKRKRQTDKC